MNGFILVLLVILIRYGIVSILGRESSERTAFFPPTQGVEKIAFLVYQITTIAMMLILIFARIRLMSIVNYVGLVVFLIGTLLYTISIIQFAKPDKKGMNTRGLYRISRNPIYVAFFLYFLGCGLLTESWLLLGVLLIFQTSVHFLILSEERWCLNKFGQEYIEYMKRVRRYL